MLCEIVRSVICQMTLFPLDSSYNLRYYFYQNKLGSNLGSFISFYVIYGGNIRVSWENFKHRNISNNMCGNFIPARSLEQPLIAHMYR